MAKTVSIGRLPLREQQAISRALADPSRYEILARIALCGSTACTDLIGCVPLTRATLSHHLRELEAAGLIRMSKRGKFVDLHFSRETWVAYLLTLTAIGKPAANPIKSIR